MTSIDIAVRSYFRDFGWLRLALASIRVFMQGYREVLLVLPESSAERWSESLVPAGLPLRIVVCPDYSDDYIGQQITKLYVDTLSDADYIAHVDSDCVFLRPTVLADDLFRRDKPIFVYRQRSRRPDTDGWRRSVREILGLHNRRELMVAMPVVYPRRIYAELRKFVRARNGLELSELALSRRPDELSEFNLLGAYAFAHMRHRFAWIEAGDGLPTGWPCAQFWGRGCTPSDIAHLLPETLRRHAFP